ncbi:MAG: 2-oxoacid:acceptor oxidoreductase family protein, partial [Mucinivorans sp.]
VAAAQDAAAAGNSKVFNMIVLGAYLNIKPLVTIENVVEGLRKSLPERAHKMIPANQAAILRGMELVQQVQVI